MKKLMIAAALATICNVGYSSPCSEPESTPVCRAWDVELKLKTLEPKKIKCEACTPCGEEPGVVYYLDGATRKIKGYIWICDYACDDEPQFNCVLWDSGNKCALVAYASISNEIQQVSASEVYVYGKKATKVAGTISFTGTDALGDLGIDVIASGVNGKLERPKNGDDCFIKSLSGTVAGTIKYVKPGYTTKAASSGLCSDAEVAQTNEYLAKLLTFCSACCFDSWCTADDAPDMVPCTGTWKIKYNKKVSTGNKSIAQLIPAYAL